MHSGLRVFGALIVLLAPAALAQNTVTFDIVAIGGTTVNPPGTSSVVVQPGAVIPFEVYATVVSDPTFPTTAGLAGFDLSVLTDFGIPQNNPFSFAPSVSTLFPVNQSTGTIVGSNVLNIAGSQSTTAGTITTGFGLNTQQLIGTGQLVAPNVEGEFTVDVTGDAQLFSLINQLQTVAAVISESRGFTVTTTSEATTPSDGQTGNGTNGNNGNTNGGTGNGGTGNGGTGDIDQPDVINTPGASGAGGPGGDVPEPDEEQVAGSISEAPTVASLNAGFCGLGVISTLAGALLGLGLMKTRRVHR